MDKLKSWQILVTSDETGQQVALEFDSYNDYQARLSNLRLEYHLLQEHTVTSTVVMRKPDLFSRSISDEAGG